jgi:hypothetical protein
MIRLDIDRRDLRPNWPLELIKTYFGVWNATGIKPLIRISGGGRGFHISIPGLTLPPDQDAEFRQIWDCLGHALFVQVRRGPDIIFSSRKGNRVQECADIWEAIDRASFERR